jgi:hypothetical protein
MSRNLAADRLRELKKFQKERSRLAWERSPDGFSELLASLSSKQSRRRKVKSNPLPPWPAWVRERLGTDSPSPQELDWLEQNLRAGASQATVSDLNTVGTTRTTLKQHRKVKKLLTKRPRTSKSAAEVRGLRRARLVATLITELNALRPLMQVPDDDFPKLAKENPNYETFKICIKHPGASQWVKRLPDRRNVHTLAFELAAAECGVRGATIQTAWKRFKNKLST